jgi:hypothetical protein
MLRFNQQYPFLLPAYAGDEEPVANMRLLLVRVTPVTKPPANFCPATLA